MKKIESYVLGGWNAGSGEESIKRRQHREALFTTSLQGPSTEEILAYGRSKGSYPKNDFS